MLLQGHDSDSNSRLTKSGGIDSRMGFDENNYSPIPPWLVKLLCTAKKLHETNINAPKPMMVGADLKYLGSYPQER